MGDGAAYELSRFRTRDGDATTVYLVRHLLTSTRTSVAVGADARLRAHRRRRSPHATR